MSTKGLHTCFFTLLFVGSMSTRGYAQYSATAEVEQPMAAGNEEEPTVAATVIHIEDRPQRDDDLIDVLPDCLLYTSPSPRDV